MSDALGIILAIAFIFFWLKGLIILGSFTIIGLVLMVLVWPQGLALVGFFGMFI